MLALFCFLACIIEKVSLKDINLQSLHHNEATSIHGSSADHYFGYSVRDAGDVNGDGIDDIIIGAPQRAAPAINSGRAYVIFGNRNGIPNINLASLTLSQGFTIEGPNIGDSTGWSVNKAGDVNGDGIGDIIIGAVHSPVNKQGAAYVIFGTKTPVANLVINSATLLSNSQGFSIFGRNSEDYLGIPVSYAGDVNGDGLDDVIVGAYATEDGAKVLVGSVYIIFGRRPSITSITDINLSGALSSTLGFIIQGPDSFSLFGIFVSGVGDMNGDGISDLIIGAARNSAAFSSGAAYVIFGHRGITDINLAYGLSRSQGFIIEGVAPDDLFGWPVGNAGDVNGDGLNDIIIGCPHAPPSKTGAAYFIFGQKRKTSNINVATTRLTSKNLGFAIYGADTENKLGYAVKTAGDINGDGVDDIIVGNSALGPGGVIISGTANVIFGSKLRMRDINVGGLKESQGFKIQGLKLEIGFESSLTYAGDINGDGIHDLAIGCDANLDSSNSIYGTVYIVPGVTMVNRGMLQAVADTQNYGTSAGRIIAMAVNLLYSPNIAALWFIYLEQILQYPKYLLIEYPIRLKYIYDKPDFELYSIPYISETPEEFEDKIPRQSIPEKFDDYYYHSSFLINFWDSMTMLAIILILIIFSSMADYLTQSNKSLHQLSSKIKFTLKWNYLIAIFTGGFCDIALFTSLEMRTLQFDSELEWISFFLCLLANVAVLAVAVKIAFVIKNFANRKAKPIQDENLRKEHIKPYQVVFERFKDQTLKQQSYFLLFALRFYLFYSIIGYLFEHTLVQAIMVNIIGLATLLYLVLVRPFEAKIDFVVSIAQETILEIVHICVFLFALDGQLGFSSGDFRVILGDIVIGCNAMFMIVGLIYSLIMTLVLLKETYLLISKKFEKQRSKSSKLKPVPLDRSLNMTNESQLVLNNKSRSNKETFNFPISMTENAGSRIVFEGLNDVTQNISSNNIKQANRINFINHDQEQFEGQNKTFRRNNRKIRQNNVIEKNSLNFLHN